MGRSGRFYVHRFGLTSRELHASCKLQLSRDLGVIDLSGRGRLVSHLATHLVTTVQWDDLICALSPVQLAGAPTLTTPWPGTRRWTTPT